MKKTSEIIAPDELESLKKSTNTFHVAKDAFADINIHLCRLEKQKEALLTSYEEAENDLKEVQYGITNKYGNGVSVDLGSGEIIRNDVVDNP